MLFSNKKPVLYGEILIYVQVHFRLRFGEFNQYAYKAKNSQKTRIFN